MALASFIPLAKFVGIVCPTLYTGFTASDSLALVEPIVHHAPSQKVMAKQWLHGYQYGPLWVPPLVLLGTLANLLLAFSATTSTQRNLYLAAAAGIFGILPITFLYMEPGINGALKWKVQLLLREEGFGMEETTTTAPSAHKHGATEASKRWAEETGVRELILRWRWVNNWRWVLGGVAAGVSGWATFSSGGGEGEVVYR